MRRRGQHNRTTTGTEGLCRGCSNEAFPWSYSCSWDSEGVWGSGRSVIEQAATWKDIVCQCGVFSSNRIVSSKETRLIVSEDEFSKEDQCLAGRKRGSSEELDATYRSRLPFWNQMSGTGEEKVCQVALLVDDASKVSVIIEPRRWWFLSKPLNTAEGEVLSDSLNKTKGGAGMLCDIPV